MPTCNANEIPGLSRFLDEGCKKERPQRGIPSPVGGSNVGQKDNDPGDEPVRVMERHLAMPNRALRARPRARQNRLAEVKTVSTPAAQVSHSVLGEPADPTQRHERTFGMMPDAMSFAHRVTALSSMTKCQGLTALKSLLQPNLNYQCAAGAHLKL